MFGRVTALVGVPDAGRFGLLRDIFDTEFRVTVVQACTVDEMVGQARKISEEQARTTSDRLVVIFTRDLPACHSHPGYRSLDLQRQNLECASVHEFLAVKPLRSDVPHPATQTFPELDLSNIDLTGMEREQIVCRLADGLRLRRVDVPQVSIDSDDAVLREQLRRLSRNCSLSEGQRLVACLVANFFDWHSLHISRLGQGGSGATVFLIEPQKGSECQRVLKLCPSEMRWKLEREVEAHQIAEAEQNERWKKLLRFFPKLMECKFPADPSVPGSGWIAQCSGWCAVSIEFLGEKRLSIIDVEEALTAPPCLLLMGLGKSIDFYLCEEKDQDNMSFVRQSLFRRGFLDWLCSNWFMRARFLPEPQPLWTSVDAPPRGYVRFPPYCFTARTKGHLIDFLEDPQMCWAEGMFPDCDWNGLKRLIGKFVATKNDGNIELQLLTQAYRVLVAPAHGDLTANNVLLWLEQTDHPLLIDLPYFQDEGHVMQDFASLEATIKFGLMDRQRNGAGFDDPVALDHSYSQVEVWREMEDLLLMDTKGIDCTPEWSGTVRGLPRHNVEFSLDLIQDIRKRAANLPTGTNRINDADFWWEYYAALLYHTLYAISNPRLSIFKRFLAIYSAARILEKLKVL